MAETNIHPDGYLKALDGYARHDAVLLPLLNQSDVNDFHDFARLALKAGMPEVAPDARYWLLSAMQRELVTRDPSDLFKLTDRGRSRLESVKTQS